MSSRVEPSVGDVNGDGPATDGDGTGRHAPDGRATDGRARDGDRDRKDGAGPIDLPRIERAVREILEAIGEDPERDGLRRHPAPGGQDVRRDLSRGSTRTRVATSA